MGDIHLEKSPNVTILSNSTTGQHLPHENPSQSFPPLPPEGNSHSAKNSFPTTYIFSISPWVANSAPVGNVNFAKVSYSTVCKFHISPWMPLFQAKSQIHLPKEMSFCPKKPAAPSKAPPSNINLSQDFPIFVLTTKSSQSIFGLIV